MRIYYQNLESLLKNNPNIEIEDFLYQSEGSIIEPEDIQISHIIPNIKDYENVILYFRDRITKMSLNIIAFITKNDTLAKLVTEF